MGFPTRDDLEWLAQRRETQGPLSVELLNPAIAGRDYQIEAVRTLLEAIEARRRKFLMVMATGTGKTRTAAALVDALMRAHWVKRVLFLVDRLALQEQALLAFKEHLPAAPRWPDQEETRFDRNRRIYVTTYPTMLNLIHAGTTPATWISPFFFDLIIADESHRSIYNVYQQVVRYFYGLTLGLTATPAITWTTTPSLFDCSTHDPTFAYGFDEAVRHDPPYLCDFEVLNVRTKSQVEGIRGPRLDEPEREQLALEGLDPDAIDFEGTDLEQKVTNSGTNAVIVHEFMEECIKDPTGTLPGKSIFFAVSVKHARRLQDLFDRCIPSTGGASRASSWPTIPGVRQGDSSIGSDGTCHAGYLGGHARHRDRRPRGDEPRLRQAGLQLHQVLADDRPRDPGPPRRPGEATPLVPREGPLPHHRLLGQLRLLQDDPQGARARPAVAATGGLFRSGSTSGGGAPRRRCGGRGARQGDQGRSWRFAGEQRRGARATGGAGRHARRRLLDPPGRR
jgi:hypothetical protein